jgi:hypothetical protein
LWCKAGLNRFWRIRLPGSLQRRLALRFLGGQDSLALCLGLTRNLCKPLGFGLTRCLRRFCGQAGCNLRLFLGLALRLLFLAASLFCLGLFYAKASFLPGLCSRSRKIAILGTMQIGPRIKSGDILWRRTLIGVRR